MNKIKIVLPLIIVSAITAIVFFTIYNETHLTGGLKIKSDKEQINENAGKLITSLNIHLKNMQEDIRIRSNKELLRQTNEDFGFKKGNSLIRNSLPGYFWHVEWVLREHSSITFSSEPNQRDNSNSPKIVIEYDNAGHLLKFNRTISDSEKLPSLSPEQAGALIYNFMTKYAAIKKLHFNGISSDTLNTVKGNFVTYNNEQFKFNSERKIELPHRIDYNYSWKGVSSYLKDDIKMEATVSGNTISNFNISYDIPEKYSTSSDNIYQTSINILFYFIIIIIIALLAYRKIKAYEIGFRTAFITAFVVMISSGLFIYTDISGEMGWAILLPLILGPLFFGASILITWAVCETITMETWKEKLLSFELLTKGHFTHSKIGRSLIIGITFGTGLISVWILILFIIQNITGVWSSSYDILLLSHLNSSSPAINILDKFTYSAFFMLAVFFNLIISGLKRRFKSEIILIVVGGLIWGLVISNDIHPLLIGMSLEIIIGIIFAFSYIKFDGLTTLVAIITYSSLNKGFALLTLGHSTFVQSGYLILSVFVIIIIYSLFSIYSKDKQIDFSSITPAFVLNITERQRLQRELEIARDVQMSFLPRQNPHIEELDIASCCIPALEVGGDYYDFTIHENKKLGVIIGDVSGKGTEAAFYMTLTKGFLKALSKSFISPTQFLREMNNLFFDNVERGTFISMVYGMFDLGQRKFTLARAGHNPVIVRSTSNKSVNILNPTGLALGLEKGNIFNDTIKEIEIEFNSGDIFVFYTDGFTEAMNKSKDEFGEEKLIALVERNSGLNSTEMLNLITKEVKTFMGKTPQHDDMTMVVVKVKT